eukprot:SAG31_NODE_59_length_29571_cov_20.443506_29_plen_155_part_00
MHHVADLHLRVRHATASRSESSHCHGLGAITTTAWLSIGLKKAFAFQRFIVECFAPNDCGADLAALRGTLGLHDLECVVGAENSPWKETAALRLWGLPRSSGGGGSNISKRQEQRCHQCHGHLLNRRSDHMYAASQPRRAPRAAAPPGAVAPIP